MGVKLSEITKKIETKLFANLLLFGLIVGFIYGLIKSIIQIINNKYFAYKLYNLILFDTQEYVNKYIFIFILISLVTLTLFIITKKIVTSYLSKYILTKPNFAEYASNIIYRMIYSKTIRSLGIGLLVFVALLNIFIIGYKEINKPKSPNVVLISIDTLRADHLGSYGYNRNTSPNIDKLAEEGVLFENAFSQAPWTFPSMASMHTSLYSSQLATRSFSNRMEDKFLTIAEQMKNSFYKTFAVHTHPGLSENFGFSQGFDIFHLEFFSGSEDITSPIINKPAVELISEHQGSPFFLWIHYLDPHGNYMNHEGFNYASEYEGTLPETNLNPKALSAMDPPLDQKDLQYVKGIYDEEISYLDRYVGIIVNHLEELGLKDNTIIIFTADHGEEFMERTRVGHGQTLYQELIHVPLIIYDPYESSLKGKRIKRNVEVRSIARTIIELCNIENSSFIGEDLFDISDSDGETTDSYVISENFGVSKDAKYQKVAIYDGSIKLIKNINQQTFELYDLKKDQQEKENLFLSQQEDIIRIKDRLLAKLLEFNQESLLNEEKVELKKEEIERLKALGYIQ